MSIQSPLLYQEIESPVGWITTAATSSGLCVLHYGRVDDVKAALTPWLKQYGLASAWDNDTADTHGIMKQLREYFDGNRRQFNLPLDLYGTAFQIAVWNALYDIPYGETRSYKDIAEVVQSPKAVRAVGMANNKNPVSLVIPCHRVIGSNGKMVGYGSGVDKKEYLLQMEGAVSASS
ncbi:methylated-DNA--[protein]-cysteine S-methyltransferase [Salibacterium halotolerans]|uniref:Methylated-DNA--protein-cysteine methyltransferase n=1 Tax=Salibacterium halotolerans TaxID=1884432 RepID=A0A1I5UK12_9BACI|nr:methylated-DNA--[protein]-cysteine S-methyltransferase [Salibacterium halotolerans]SFP95582.1 methylated-DNA-[protein]-cysteine S-methyltransferase [Salibacterium halotolerans]